MLFGRCDGSLQNLGAPTLSSQWCAVWSLLGEMSSGSRTAEPRLRDPSLEPTLEAE